MEISLANAWQIWWSGQTLNGDLLLWGIQIRWWGRIGQVVQLVSALTILAEIVGAERLHAFGRSLHGRIDPKHLRETIRECVQYFSEHEAYMTGRLSERVFERFSGWFPLLNMLTGYGIMFTAVHMAFQNWWLTIPLGFFLGGAFLTYYGYIVVIPIVVIAMLIGIVIDLLVFEPLGWLVGLAAVDTLVKVVSVIALLIGFHFSLLAS